MKDLQVNARLKVRPGNMEALKVLAQSCVETVQQKDSGTLQYDWFFNDELSECIVRERYASSEAALEHAANLGDKMGQLFALADISFGIFGDVSPALKDALKDFDVTYYEFGTGL